MKIHALPLLIILLPGLATAYVPIVDMAEHVVAASPVFAPLSEPTKTMTATVVPSPTSEAIIQATRTTTPSAALDATAVPSPIPSATPPFDGARAYPADTRTGIETIDRVIEIVLNISDEALSTLLVGFTTQACTHELGLGGPPKFREGESEGTPVEVLFRPGIEGSYACREEFQAHFGLEAAGVVAIYRVAEAAETRNGYDIIFLAGQLRSLVLKVDQRAL